MPKWKEYKLGEVVNIKNGKSRPKEDGIVPVYGGNGILGYSNKSNVDGESIIIGRVGAYCGAVYYENNPVWISDNALYAKSENGFNTKFLYYLLKQDNLRAPLKTQIC
jgi:type I restriction enzyme S subunit